MPESPSNSSARDGALLAHSDFVRRLARALVGRGEEADDLVQETWVTALSHPPRASHPSSARAWLARVMRNALAQSRRGSVRRADRERAQARTEAQGDDTRSVEQLELHEQLIQRVLALRETERTTLVLRYLEDRPPREVAQRMGVSVNTVHTRLRRALARLRSELDEASQGKRQEWCALLLPGAPFPAHIASKSAATVWMTSMSLKVAASLALGLILVTSLLMNLGETEDAEDALRVGATSPPSSEVSDRVHPLDVSLNSTSERVLSNPQPEASAGRPAPEAAPGVATPTTPKTRRLHGHVRLFESDGSESPAPTGHLNFKFMQDQPGQQAVVTNGEFEFEWAHWGEPTLGEAFLDGAPAQLDGDVEMPLVGEHVELVFQRTSTWTLHVVDADSRRELEDVEIVQVDGWEAGLFRPSETLERRVLITNGTSPLELPSGSGRQKYWARAAGFAWNRFDVDHDAHKDMTVELSASAGLRVTCEPDDVSSRLELRLYEGGFEGFDPAYTAMAVTPGQSVHFDDIPAGDYQLRAEVGRFPQRPILFAQREVHVKAGELLELVLELDSSLIGPPAAPLAGTLILPKSILDMPLELLLMRAVGPGLHPNDEQRVSVSQLRALETTGHFAFDFGSVTPGRIKFGLLPLRQSWVVDVPSTGTRNLKLECEDVARVRVEVIDASTGERLPVEGIAWSPWPAGLWQVEDPVRGSDAESFLSGMSIAHPESSTRVAEFLAPVGPLHFGYWHEGYGEGGTRVDVVAERTNTVELQLSPVPMLELGFVDTDGVLVYGRGFTIESEDAGAESELLRQSGGRYIYTFEKESTWRVLGAPRGYAPLESPTITVKAGERPRLDVRVRSTDS